MKTIKELSKEAIDVQNASNLSGIVHSFSRAMTDLRANLPNAGTDEINSHPVSVLYSNKIASLTNSDSGVEFARAYDACSKEVEG